MLTNEVLHRIVGSFGTLSPDRFTALIDAHVRARSNIFTNVVLGPRSGDRKVDISAQMVSHTGDPGTVLIQCKRELSRSFNATVVSEMRVALERWAAHEAIIVSVLGPTSDARDLIAQLRTRGVRIQWELWYGLELARTLAKHTPLVLNEFMPGMLGFAIAAEAKCPSFEVLSTNPSPHTRAAEFFYNGHLPTWDDIAKRRDVPRTIYERDSALSMSLRDRLPRLPSAFIQVLLGVGGSGKSTLLRRIGYDLSQEGYLVLRLRDDWASCGIGLTQQLRDALSVVNDPVVVLLDDAADVFGSRSRVGLSLSELDPNLRLLILAAEHPEQWNTAKRRVTELREPHRSDTCYIQRLSDRECERLVDVLMAHESSGEIASFGNLDRGSRLALCRDFADRHLVVAMLQMRHGRNFRAIIEREYERIPFEPGQIAYGLVAYLNLFGRPVPRTVIEGAVDLVSPVDFQRFAESTEGLFKESSQGMAARHPVIGRVVAAHAFTSPRAKSAALLQTIKNLDYLNITHEEWFLSFFSSGLVSRRLVRDLGSTDTVLSEWLEKAVRKFQHWPPDLRKYVFSTLGQVQRALGNQDAAREAFDQAINLDGRFRFALRQRAWLERDAGAWDSAASFARAAANIAPDDFLSVYHCGLILMFSKTKHFRAAGQFLERARLLDPEDMGAARNLERYRDAQKVLSYIVNAGDDEVIPAPVIHELRPGLSFWKAAFGNHNRGTTDQLRRVLQQMQKETHGDLLDLTTLTRGFNVNSNRFIHGLVACNVARLQYLEWYHRREEHDLDQIELLFKKSLDLNSQDPFTHCWLGTFLKEARSDYDQADYHYQKALGLVDGDPRMRRYPLFLNNTALLIIDKVRAGKAPVAQLSEALGLLSEAVARVDEMQLDFVWASVTLAFCRQVIRDLEKP